MRRVVRARVARLAPATRSLLTTAAVLTVGFELALVRDAAGLPDDAAVQAADEALEAGLLVVTPDPDAPYGFAHAIVRMALLDELNPDRRAAVHRRVAESAAALHPDRHALIAEHYGASRTLPGADAGVAHCLAAAEEGARAGGPLAAVRWLTLALALLPTGDAPGRAALQGRLAAAQADALLTREAPSTALEAAAALPDAEAAALLLRVATALRLGSAAGGVAAVGRRGVGAVRRTPRRALGAHRAAARSRRAGAVGAVVRRAVAGLPARRHRAPGRHRRGGRCRRALRAVRRAHSRRDARGLRARGALEQPHCAAAHARPHRPRLEPAARAAAARAACYEELLGLALRVGSLPAQAEAQAQLGFCHAPAG